jgi:hypothetical protein
VFARNPEAFLGIGYSIVFGFLMSQKIGFELIHPCIGKHQSGVILNDHGGRGYYLMGFGFKKF